MASSTIHHMIALTSDSSWDSWCNGNNPRPLHSIFQALAEESLFHSLAKLLAMTAVYIRCNTGSPTAVETLTVHLISGYRRSVQQLPDCALTQHAPWLLLAVPGILQCSGAILEQCTVLMPVILASSLHLSPTDLRGKVHAAAALLSGGARKAPAHVTLCCLHMLSTLMHSICSTSERLTARHVVAFCRMARLLVSLLPRVARMQLAAVLIDLSGQEHGSLCIPVAACFGGDGMDEDEDVDNAFTPAADWFLPGDTVTDDNMPDAPPEGATDEVTFPTPLAATQVVSAQLQACVADGVFTAADGVREVSLWLFTLLSLSQSDPLLSEKVATAWANAPCQLIRVIWRQGLQTHMRSRVLDSSTTAVRETAAWQPEQPVQPWMVPLMTLCAVYSQYVSTAPDDSLFGEQVTLTLSRACCACAPHLCSPVLPSHGVKHQYAHSMEFPL